MRVTDLERVRVERLVPSIAAELQARRVARAPVPEVDDVARWRRAARLAGRHLGWHVRTGVSSDWVSASSEDWEALPGSDLAAAIWVGALIVRRGWPHSAPTFRRARESAKRTGNQRQQRLLTGRKEQAK